MEMCWKSSAEWAKLKVHWHNNKQNWTKKTIGLLLLKNMSNNLAHQHTNTAWNVSVFFYLAHWNRLFLGTEFNIEIG